MGLDFMDIFDTQVRDCRSYIKSRLESGITQKITIPKKFNEAVVSEAVDFIRQSDGDDWRTLCYHVSKGNPPTIEVYFY